MAQNNLAFILAGGRGSRVYPLTKTKAKPALPYAGNFRLIDFPLSNLYNSKIKRICVLTQYQHELLHWHIRGGWYPLFPAKARPPKAEEYIVVLPTMETSSKKWTEGSAEAVQQNKEYIEESGAPIIDIFGADHVYFMNVSQMNSFHTQKNANLTISAIPVKREIAVKNFGVIEVDKNGQVISFEEKPENPRPIPGNKEYCLASMGNYAFGPEALLEQLAIDEKKEYESKEVVAGNPAQYTTHDFGFDIIPAMLREGKKVFAYDFSTNSVPGETEEEKGYWLDVGSLKQLYDANMAVRSSKPPINIYNDKWKINTCTESDSPVRGSYLESIVANGCIIGSAADVQRSVFSYNVKVADGSKVYDCIFLGNNEIGKGAIVKGAILDEGVIVPGKEIIGINKKEDEEKGYYGPLKDYPMPVIPKGFKFK